jgi:hypothetical protein
MAAAKMAAQGTKPVVGKALLMLGGIFLVAQVALLTWHAEQYWNQTGARTAGLLSAVGTMLVHTVNTLAWNPGAALASAAKVLVSCWPLLLLVAGILLLRKNAASR